jgi:hypothetical protein
LKKTEIDKLDWLPADGPIVKKLKELKELEVRGL